MDTMEKKPICYTTVNFFKYRKYGSSMKGFITETSYTKPIQSTVNFGL